MTTFLPICTPEYLITYLNQCYTTVKTHRVDNYSADIAKHNPITFAISKHKLTLTAVQVSI